MGSLGLSPGVALVGQMSAMDASAHIMPMANSVFLFIISSPLLAFFRVHFAYSWFVIIIN